MNGHPRRLGREAALEILGRGDPISTNDLAKATGYDRASIARVMQKLEAEGLARRHQTSYHNTLWSLAGEPETEATEQVSIKPMPRESSPRRALAERLLAIETEIEGLEEERARVLNELGGAQ